MHTTTLVLQAYGLVEPDYSWDSATILCPFHGERTPSLSFELREGVFFCFGCGASGSIIDFIARFERVSSWEALRLFVKLSKQEGGVVRSPVSALDEKEKRRAALSNAYAVYASSMAVDWRWAGEHYLLRRGLTSRTLAHFGVRLNLVSTHEIIIPIMEQGRFRGYVARRADEEGRRKYLFNKGFARGKTVDGRLVHGPVAVVEGKLDQMMAWQHGFHNVGCIFGSHITPTQVKKLAGYATVLYSWFDPDEAGEHGHQVLVKEAARYGLEVVRPAFPPGPKDVGEMGFAAFAQFAYLPNITNVS